ncbi:T9SS type A sorting domain-containing protein [Taibaiella soli]|uniref:Secretion system C-terminal sorting domain-containing protein n=1 Tax=Taibaiella soli TaxID=1649169 RepID=A0A2W2BLX8_9BACT|nr:T9SS type A sorting domain-containing protein [Taibaiella soli]PZF74446.1 hypothetical protein DN068_02375 [Taibaiella soli]
MKKTLLFLLSVASFIGVYAQPVIHGYDVNPVPGETIEIKSKNNQSLNLGANGANQAWDFSNLSQTQGYINTITSAYSSPVGTPGAFSFPDANLRIQYNPSDTIYYYYNADSSSYKYLGYGDTSGGAIGWVTNPRSVFRYPLTYNTHYIDTINEIFTAPSSNDTETTHGIIDRNVVAYGSLTLPSGTFNNVLKITSTTTDTTYMQQDIYIDLTIETYWLYPGIHTPLLYSESDFGQIFHPNGSITNTGGTSFFYATGTPTAVNEIVAKKYKVTCFPNPAQNTVNLGFELKQPGDVVVKVMAANGTVVLKQENHYGQSGATTLPLNINQLAAGIYFADLNISGVHINQQFIKN